MLAGLFLPTTCGQQGSPICFYFYFLLHTLIVLPPGKMPRARTACLRLKEKNASRTVLVVPDSSISSTLIHPTFQCTNYLCSAFRRWRFILYYFLSQSQLPEGQLSRAWEGPSLLRAFFFIFFIGIGIGIMSERFGDRYFLDCVMNTTRTFCGGMGFQNPTYRINRLYLSSGIMVTSRKHFSESLSQ